MPPAPTYDRRVRIALALGAIGCAIASAVQTMRFGGGALFSVMWLDWQMSEAVVVQIMNVYGWVLVAAAIAVCTNTSAARVAYLAIGLCLLAHALATTSVTARHAEWVLAAQATRWLGAIAAMLWLTQRRALAFGLLRVAAAATFIAHGVEAITSEPAFFDYVVMASREWLGSTPDRAVVELTLRVIGVVDIAVALLLLVTHWSGVALWMAFWGSITALSRVVHSGFEAYHEVLLRLPNAMVPLAIWFVMRDPARAAQRVATLVGPARPRNRLAPSQGPGQP